MAQATLLSERGSMDPENPPDLSVPIREILFPSDLSPESDRAFEHAALLARRFGAHVTLYHAVAAPPAPADPRDPACEALRLAVVAAREHLERRGSELKQDWDITVDREDSVQPALERMLETCRPDLVVMATHRRGGIAKLLLGSVAESVVRRGRAPVLCVREPDHGVALPYRRILVPTDLSLGSRRAFRLAAELARGFAAEVVALHVAAVPAGAAASGTSGVSDFVERLVPSEERLKAFLMPEFLGLKITPRAFVGSPWNRIVETALAEHADLIVMSTHGRDTLADRVLGSHTERVVRHSSCPVLVV